MHHVKANITGFNIKCETHADIMPLLKRVNHTRNRFVALLWSREEWEK